MWSPYFFFILKGITMILTPLTPLDAVNEILSAIGEAPVDTIEDSGNIDVDNAYRILKSVNRQVQIDGYTFNTISSYPLIPDRFTKEIAWDSTLLRVSTTEGNFLRNRGGLVYDVTNNTDKFDGQIEVEAIVLVPFEELPEAFREYITIKSARLFATRYLGDELAMNALMQEEQIAKIAVFNYELDLEKPSMANNTDISNDLKRT
ncbi:hypothetical protein [Veillonella sp. LMAG:90]|uniref:hypothetical protein n=2 Tax=unclassified Veillonella TaxID=2630086 RepID=UPI0025CC1B42|nr:hypothetical protein [Veillonella sp. LMAG:90]